MTLGPKALLVAACAVFVVTNGILAQEVTPVAPEATTAPEAAQPVPDREPVDTVQFSVSLQGDYLDNRDTSEADKESTFDFYVRPRLDLVGNWERSMADLYYAPALRYRTDPSDLQNDSELYHDLGLLLRHDLNPSLRLRLSENFNFTDDPSVSQDGDTLRRSDSFFLNRVAGGATYQFNPRTDADVSAFYSIKRYDEELVADESDEDRLGGDVAARRQVTRNLTALAMVGMRDYDFESAVADRGSTVLMAGVGLDDVLSPNLRLGARAGWQTADYGDSTIDSEDLPYLNAHVLGAPGGGRTRLRGEATYQLRDSDVYPFVTQEATDFYGGVEYDVTELVTLGLNGTYRISQYDEDTIPAGAPRVEGGDETTILARAQVSLELSDNTLLSLEQRYEDVSSDVDTSYDANTTSIMLTQKF